MHTRTYQCGVPLRAIMLKGGRGNDYVYGVFLEAVSLSEVLVGKIPEYINIILFPSVHIHTNDIHFIFVFQIAVDRTWTATDVHDNPLRRTLAAG